MTNKQANKIIRYLKKWDELLSHDGLNTKMMVRNDIQYLLKDISKIKYLRWSDLKFENHKKFLRVRLGDNVYLLEYRKTNETEEAYLLDSKKMFVHLFFIKSELSNKTFNDLKMEVLEDVEF